MVSEQSDAVDYRGERTIQTWRCVNCGAIVDGASAVVKKPNMKALKILVAVSALAFAGPALAQELKIGTVEPQKVLEQTKEGKKVKDVLQDYVAARQKVIDQEEEDLKKMEDDLVKQGAVLAPDARKSKEDQFRQRLSDYQRNVQQMNQEVQVKKKETLEEFTKKLEQIVRSIADGEKIMLVLEKGENGAGALIIYSSPSFDLTDRVIKEMDRKAGK